MSSQDMHSKGGLGVLPLYRARGEELWLKMVLEYFTELK